MDYKGYLLQDVKARVEKNMESLRIKSYISEKTLKMLWEESVN